MSYTVLQHVQGPASIQFQDGTLSHSAKMSKYLANCSIFLFFVLMFREWLSQNSVTVDIGLPLPATMTFFSFRSAPAEAGTLKHHEIRISVRRQATDTARL